MRPLKFSPALTLVKAGGVVSNTTVSVAWALFATSPGTETATLYLAPLSVATFRIGVV